MVVSRLPSLFQFPPFRDMVEVSHFPSALRERKGRQKCLCFPVDGSCWQQQQVHSEPCVY